MANLWLPPESDIALAARGWPGPGVKPTGQVEIDWLHPQARGLQSAWIVQNGKIVELVKNRQPTFSNITIGVDFIQTAGSTSSYVDLPIFDEPKGAGVSFIDVSEKISGSVVWSYLRDAAAWTGIYSEGPTVKTTDGNSFDGAVTPTSGSAQSKARPGSD